MNRRNFFQLTGAVLLGGAIGSKPAQAATGDVLLRARGAWEAEQKRVEADAISAFDKMWRYVQEQQRRARRESEEAIIREREAVARFRQEQIAAQIREEVAAMLGEI